MTANAQLTDGGPPATPGLSSRVAGRPFGAAPGSAFSLAGADTLNVWPSGSCTRISYMPHGRQDGGSTIRAPFRVDVEIEPHAWRALTLLRQHELHLPTPHERESRRPPIPPPQEPLIPVGPRPTQAETEKIDIILDAAPDAMDAQNRPTSELAAAVVSVHRAMFHSVLPNIIIRLHCVQSVVHAGRGPACPVVRGPGDQSSRLPDYESLVCAFELAASQPRRQLDAEAFLKQFHVAKVLLDRYITVSMTQHLRRR